MVSHLRPHAEGFYGSFKWLTNEDWADPLWRPETWHGREYKEKTVTCHPL